MKSQIGPHRTLSSPLCFNSLLTFGLFRSLVSFGPKQRSLGEAAKTLETSNFRNTIGGLKRLIGRTYNDPEVHEVEKKFHNATLVDVNGTVGVQVSPQFCMAYTAMLSRKTRSILRQYWRKSVVSGICCRCPPPPLIWIADWWHCR